MIFAQALRSMICNGYGIQREGWAEYWHMHKGQIRVCVLDGSCYPLERMYSIRYILESAASEDWVLVPTGKTGSSDCAEEKR